MAERRELAPAAAPSCSAPLGCTGGYPNRIKSGELVFSRQRPVSMSIAHYDQGGFKPLSKRSSEIGGGVGSLPVSYYVHGGRRGRKALRATSTATCRTFPPKGRERPIYITKTEERLAPSPSAEGIGQNKPILAIRARADEAIPRQPAFRARRNGAVPFEKAKRSPARGRTPLATPPRPQEWTGEGQTRSSSAGSNREGHRLHPARGADVYPRRPQACCSWDLPRWRARVIRPERVRKKQVLLTPGEAGEARLAHRLDQHHL